MTSLRKKSGYCLQEKINFKTHDECLNKLFWPNLFIRKTISANMYETMNFHKNKIPYYNGQDSKI
jgi:hypothetical protein